MDPRKSVTPVSSTNGSYIIYQEGTITLTLTFVASVPPPAGFKVVVGTPDPGLPSGYTWVQSFGIQNSGGQYLPSVTYILTANQAPPMGQWFVYYNGRANPLGTANNPLSGQHTSPGDPPVGYG